MGASESRAWSLRILPSNIMIASRVQAITLRDAAHEIGVVVDMSTLNAAGTRHQVKLYPQTPIELYRPACKRCRERNIRACRCRRWPDERGDARYQRTSARGNDHRVHAVCWHGFRDFFRAVYRIEPDARFRTAMDTWRGSADFEARFRQTGYKNIGSQMCPVSAAEACRCPESGMIDLRTQAEAYSPDMALPDPQPTERALVGSADARVQPDGIADLRWSEYNRKFNDLIAGRN